MDTGQELTSLVDNMHANNDITSTFFFQKKRNYVNFPTTINLLRPAPNVVSNLIKILVKI
jgi:CRISPR/Cas system CSM-associated protein Csm4 (group 5 of RAMP superfamily)